MKLFAAYITFVLALAIGWVMNIVQIYHSNFNTISGVLIVKIIGIFIPPLGSLLGYLG